MITRFSLIAFKRLIKLVNELEESVAILQGTGVGGTTDYNQLSNKPDLSSLHEPESDNQDLSNLVVEETGKSLVSNTEIIKIHSPESDNQDLSGLQPKETDKGLSTNDYSNSEKTKLSGIEGNAVALQTIKSDSDIADTISKKHNEAHNHLGVYEPLDEDIQNHIISAHAPSNAQKNSDILKSEIEAKLIGELSSHSHAGGGGGLGYTINVQALTSSPVDAQTVYFGMLPKAPVTTANISKIYIRKAGTIKIAEIYCYSGTAGTNQAWSLYIRKNNTTDYLIATLSVATNERVFSNTGLSIPLAVGDWIEIKGVQPTWTTNPLTTIYGGYVYIE